MILSRRLNGERYFSTNLRLSWSKPLGAFPTVPFATKIFQDVSSAPKSSPSLVPSVKRQKLMFDENSITPYAHPAHIQAALDALDDDDVDGVPLNLVCN